MIKTLQELHVPLTRTLCETHAALPQIDGDRPLREDRVKFLREKFNEGLFHGPEWAVANYGGKTFRINGKHSSNMLLSLNGHFPAGLYARIKQFDCTTPEDLALLFQQFDAQQSTRNSAEKCAPYKMLRPELADVSTSAVNNALIGVAWYLAEKNGVLFAKAEQPKLLSQFPKPIAFVAQFMGTRRLNRKGVAAAIFATYLASSEAAVNFWPYVRDENHEDKDNPTRTLGAFLRHVCIDPIDRNTRKKWDTPAYFAKCIHGWNAYREERTTNLKFYADSELPEPI